MLSALDIYRRLVSILIRSQMQYRLQFIFDIITTAVVNGISFIILFLILQKFDGIGGWKLWEIALLYGFVETPFGFMDMIFSGFDPGAFGKHVRLGSFDQMLLRPVNITLQVLGSDFMTRRLGRILQGGVVLALAIANAGIQWTALKIFLIPVVLVSMVAFYGGLFVFGAGITFWTVESIEAVNIFTYGGTELMAYPMHIFPTWMVRFFTYILPAIFLGYYPAVYILEKSDPFGMPGFAPFLAPLVGFGVLFLGLSFWNFGLRHYQSTGT